MTRIFLLIFALLILTACGPTLFTVGGIVNVTAGDIATVPIKKKIIEEIKEKPNKTANNQLLTHVSICYIIYI